MAGKHGSTGKTLLLVIVLLGLPLFACERTKTDTYSVGVLNIVPDLDQTYLGFKQGMTALGYVEGSNIRYHYDGPTTDIDRLGAAAQALLAAKVDLILSITTPATSAAQNATDGLDLPVVFAVVTDPLGAGIVADMQRPGGNISGVTFGVQEVRRLEWLVRIAPQSKRIYVPYNAKDKSPVLALKTVREAAAKLGVELITREFNDPKSLAEAVTHIPAEVDAIFLLPDSLLGTRIEDLVTTANNRKLPMSGANIMVVKNYQVLTSFGCDVHQMGIQAARMADQIFRGARPTDLPIETAEFYLAVNLKTADTIGLSISDEVLRQADIIVR
jgi:putative ABC transport system substrate-binding protein